MVTGSLNKLKVTVIQRTGLVDALKKLALMINSKSKISVLQFVRFDVTKEHINITATNGRDIAVVTLDNNYHADSDSFIISFQYLNDFLKKSKAKLIELEITNVLTIKADKINFEMLRYDESEFPHMPKADFNFLEMNMNDFNIAMKNTLFACATSESRPVLTGVNINYDTHEHLRFVATDSHRLATFTFDTYTNKNSERVACNVVVPSFILSKIIKLISKKTKTVTIGFNDVYTLIRFDDVEYWVRNVEGNYPDVSRLIPDDHKTTIELYSDELKEAVNVLSIISKDDRNNTICFERTKEETSFNSNSPELGKMKAELLTNSFSGQDIKVSFSSKYFTDALTALSSEIVQMNFTGAMRPFTMINPLDNRAMHLILPVRTY